MYDFLRRNPYTADGVHYKQFLTVPASSNEDAEWDAYLERLSEDEWADQTVIQALADMLSVNIDVLTTSRPDMNPVIHHTCRDHPVGTITIGLIGQLHYVALEKQQHTDSQVQQCTQEHACLQIQHSASHQNNSPQCNQSLDQEFEKCDYDDEEAQHELVQIRGLPYKSGLQKEEVESEGDKIYSLAPGEGQKPLNIFTDEHFEEMSKYPYGRGGGQ